MDLGTAIVCATSVVMAGTATIRYINTKTKGGTVNTNGNGNLKTMIVRLSDVFMKKENCPPEMITKSLEEGAKNFKEINNTLKKQAVLLARIDERTRINFARLRSVGEEDDCVVTEEEEL